MATLEKKTETITKLLDDSKRLLQELQVMQGLVHKLSKKSDQNSLQILDVTKRGMEQNLIIQGIDDEIETQDPKREQPMFTTRERCKYSVLNFLKTEMNIDLAIEDIWKAHRTGVRKPNRVRPMIVKLSYAAKDLIMEKMSLLKGRKNPKTEQSFFISEQIPEGIIETRKQNSIRLNHLQEQNEKKPKENRSKIQVINDKILVDDKLDEPEVKTPQPSELFVDKNTQEKVDWLQSKIIETEPITVKNSQFTGLAIKVHSIQEVKHAYLGVVQRYPAADHVMLAYALKEQGTLKHGGCDDREYGASSRMKKVMFENKTKNTAIFVLRQYGGVHLGFKRFKTIEGVAKEAINAFKQEYP